MYLKCHSRVKDGKEHHYYSIAEKVPCAGGRRVERHVFYLGEINDSQKEAWLKQIEAFDLGTQQQTKLTLLASDRLCRQAPRRTRCKCAYPNFAFTVPGNGAPAGCLCACGSS
jgi:hypothetical protein